nr:integrase, catalytic region, zinc finger, CCHC-type, peptidase aspartic, catalytic [Tanacetum cinerariifolium]
MTTLPDKAILSGADNRPRKYSELTTAEAIQVDYDVKATNIILQGLSPEFYALRKVWKPTGKVFTKTGYTWRPTDQTFTIVKNACPLTRITTTIDVPLRKPTALETDAPKPVVTLVYLRKPRKSKTNVHVSKPKIIKSISANKKEPNKSWGSTVSNVPSSSLDECRNVTISRVYYVEGLRHNLFSVGKFCDSNLKVAFHQHSFYICKFEGVDLLTRSRGNNLYTLSLEDMMASSPICLLSKASNTKSWLWHRRFYHLNFSAINHLARHSLIRGLLKLKFEKDHLCSTCTMGKIKKKPHKPKSEDTNQEKLYLLHMDLYGPMRVASINGKNEKLGKLQPKADIGIFIRYGPTKKAFQIYNRRTRRNIETIHIDFDELTTMASEHSSLEPALHERTPATISLGLVGNTYTLSLHTDSDQKSKMEEDVKNFLERESYLLSLSFDFVYSSEIFKSLSFCLNRPCHLAILCSDHHAYTLHHLESLLTISLDRLDFLKEDLVYQKLRKSLSLCLSFLDS